MLYVFAQCVSIPAVLSLDDQNKTRINRFGNSQASTDKVFLSVTHSRKWETESEKRNMFIKLCSPAVFFTKLAPVINQKHDRHISKSRKIYTTGYQVCRAEPVLSCVFSHHLL